MGKLDRLKHKLQDKASQSIVEEIIKRLESAVELKDQGKDAEGDVVVNDMKDWLDGMIRQEIVYE